MRPFYPQQQADSTASTAFSRPVTQTIVAFLQVIGLSVQQGYLDAPTFVPGIWLNQGVIVFDESAMLYPGDLLHEAGHLAVMTPERRRIVTSDAGSDPAEEMMAIAWSYAAALYLTIDPAVVFHEAGYRGGSSSVLENFQSGHYFGVPMLEWLGLTYDKGQAASRGVMPYPHMVQWLRST